MSCTNPKPAIIFKCEDSSTGQRIKFLKRQDQFLSYPELQAKYGKDLLMIPCGHCESCIELRTKSWAVRCCLEAGQYSENCFVTLTYNDTYLPKFGVSKKDIQRFIKNLRNLFGAGIRYFGCAEYGSLGRAHYHLILFNFFPPDAKCLKQNPFGGFYFQSSILEDLWRTEKKINGYYRKLGFVSVGEVSYNSCAYVARYCMKKLGQELGVVGQNKEFSFMSRRPGIGEKYFRDHFDSLVQTDTIYGEFGDKNFVSSFRYFDKLIERVNPDLLQDLKAKRIEAGVDSVASELLLRNLPSMGSYFKYQESKMKEKYSRLRRSIV